ncbi:hypothetical protein ACAG25_23230 [Mycobacterium sp. pV006]|uniref:hypothetical protein n=1 Tax=Mycobacterium sp. pV006 TaxID=3238983 RepID=UPI00351AE344
MAFRALAVTIVAAVAVVVSAGWAAEPVRADPSSTTSPPPTFTGGCGVVSYPGTGARGVVEVTSGPVSCTAAMDVMDRYLHDPLLVHTGNTWSAEFDGWVCTTPTAAAAEAYGYMSACRDSIGGEILVTPERVSPEPTWVPCDATVIAADLGELVHVRRCYGSWAYVGSGEVGDARSLIRFVDGTWTRYTSFPSSICAPQAVLDGVPAPELRNFTC